MNAFLSKISQLHSICDVILLSSKGEPLFSHQTRATTSYSISKNIASWNALITSLDRPLTADFIFSNGRVFLQQTDIGYLIIGMLNESDLNRVKIACKNVRDKLSDASTRKQILLKMLADVDDGLKPNVIKELMPLADADVASVLISLLQRNSEFQANTRNKLLLFICQALGYCSSHEAIEPLNAMLATEGANRFSPDITSAARIAIQQLEQCKPQARMMQPPAPQPAAPAQAAPLQRSQPPEAKHNNKAFTVPDVKETQEILTLLNSSNKNEAQSRILQAIETYSRGRDFVKAESLRNWLIDIDSMAIQQIIRAAEIIEEERKASISKEHLLIWKDLINTISIDAFSALYHAFTQKKYATGEPIVSQGDLHSTLFFVNSGKVQLHVTCQGKTESIRVLEHGEVFGTETFFEVSVWTIGAKSQGAEIFQLPYPAFHSLKDNYPALEAKLLEYCGKFQSPKTFFSKTRKTRRQHERKKASNRVSISLLDNNGHDTGKNTKGDLFDISRGGLSLIFHSSQKKAADKLLGKKIRIAIHCGNYGTQLIRLSTIRAIGGNDPIGNRYSMHVEFEELLTAADLQQINTK